MARFDAWEANGSAASVRAHRRPSSAPQRRLKTKGTMARTALISLVTTMTRMDQNDL